MRKLASIQVIDEILDHPNADKLEIAVVNGWKSIVKKDEFKVGDTIIYCEIDSWIPHDIAPFLTKPGANPKVYLGVEGQRLRTMKLRGVLSQGLIIPLHESEIAEVGDDVTELLGILKWEAQEPASLGGQSKGSFPTFIFKTDQERVQNIWKSLTNPYNKFSHNQWEVTTKLDGSSMTVYLNNGEFGVCSRNQELKDEGENLFWKVAKQNKMEDKLRSLGKNIALQGELMGEGIQKNRENLKGHQFFLYDIFLIDEGRHATVHERISLMFHLNYKIMDTHIESVPSHGIVGFTFEDFTLEKFMDYCDKMNGGVSLNAKTREGLVFKSTTVNKFGQVDSFKVISNDYLLKG